MEITGVIARNARNMFKTRLSRMTITMVVLLPLLYSGLYLWAFWNPYARMKDLPVAIVNLDEGAANGSAGQVENYGKGLVKNLISSKSLKWQALPQGAARQRLKDGGIYFYLEVPRGFSRSIVSASSASPRKASLRFVVNEAGNVLVPQIGGNVVSKVRERYSREVTKQMVALLLEAGKSAAGGVTQAASGASRLAVGSKALASGGASLAGNLGRAYAGSTLLTRGISSLHAGSASLSQGLSKADSGSLALNGGLRDVALGVGHLQKGLVEGVGQVQKAGGSLAAASAGAKALATGASSSAEGGARVTAGLRQLSDGLSKTAAGASQLSTRLLSAAGEVQKLADSPDFRAIPEIRRLAAATAEAARGADQLKDAIGTAAISSSQILDGAKKVSDAQVALAAGSRSLADGLESSPAGMKALEEGLTAASAGLGAAGVGLGRLQAGAADLHDGMVVLQAGSTRIEAGAAAALSASGELAGGLGKLSLGATSLSDGIARLDSGASELAGRLTTGAQLVGGLQSAKTLQNIRAEVISSPIRLDTVRVNPVDTYGTGFAPYFLSLSLWVGALLMFFAVDMRYSGVDLSRHSRAIPVYGKFGAVAAFAALQGLLSCGVIHLVLGSPVGHVWGYYGLGVLTALAFTAIQYLLVSALGMAGRFVSLVVLMLQLTSCGGTFPPELIPPFFQAIKRWLPMTYTVTGFKGLISGAGMAEASLPMLVLFVTGLVAVLVSPLFVRKDLERNELQPLVEVLMPGSLEI